MICLPLDLISVFVAFWGGGNFRPSLRFIFYKNSIGILRKLEANNKKKFQHISQTNKEIYFEVYTALLLLL